VNQGQVLYTVFVLVSWFWMLIYINSMIYINPSVRIPVIKISWALCDHDSGTKNGTVTFIRKGRGKGKNNKPKTQRTLKNNASTGKSPCLWDVGLWYHQYDLLYSKKNTIRKVSSYPITTVFAAKLWIHKFIYVNVHICFNSLLTLYP
jgi:hypothetical protein